MADDWLVPYEAWQGLITAEHNQRPRYMDTVGLSVKPLAQSLIVARSLWSLFDLDTAVGQQLDFVGQWIGLTRYIKIDLNLWFSFNTYGLGFDQGKWFQSNIDPVKMFRLDDPHYRILLKARVIANMWDGTIPNAYDAWNTLFAGTGYAIVLQDGFGRHNDGDSWPPGKVNGTMRILQGVLGPPLDAVTKALFQGGYLGLKSAGVRVDYMIQWQPGTPPPSLIPAGETPASRLVPAFIFNGSAASSFRGSTSGSFTLTTTLSNNTIIVASIAAANSNVAPKIIGITGAGLTFRRRKRWLCEPGTAANTFCFEEYWAYAPVPLTSQVFTIVYDATLDGASVNAWAVNGCDQTDPFDHNPSLPQIELNVFGGGSSGAGPVATIGVRAAGTMVIGILGSCTNRSAATPGAPLTLIRSNTGSGGPYIANTGAAYRTLTDAEDALVVGYDGAFGFLGFGYLVDALVGASGALPSLDGSAVFGGGTDTGSFTLTTTQPNTVLILGSASGNASITSPPILSITDTGPGLVWTRRQSVIWRNMSGAGGTPVVDSSNTVVEEWYTIAPAPLSAVAFTINYTPTTSGQHVYAGVAFAVKNCRIANPFDNDPSLPAAQSGVNPGGSAAIPSVQISTDDAAFLFAAPGVMNMGIVPQIPPTGFTAIQHTSIVSGTADTGLGSGYEVVSSAQSHRTVTWGETLNQSAIGYLVDALSPPRPPVVPPVLARVDGINKPFFGFNAGPLLPPAAPVLTAFATGGSLPTGTAFVKITYLNEFGESLASAETSIAVTGPTGRVVVASPAASGTGVVAATGWNIYSAGATNTEKLNSGGPIAIGTSYTITAYGTGANPPKPPVAYPPVTVAGWGMGAWGQWLHPDPVYPSLLNADGAPILDDSGTPIGVP